ncbi:MAG: plasmid mobilization protein [Eubacteriales bacterium]|jgi:hypothetical protein
MIHRMNEIKVRLNDDELNALNSNVQRTSWSREQYIRKLLKGVQPVSVPPIDYYNMIREIRRVGYNMRQVAQRAYALDMVDAPQYEKNASSVLNLCDELTLICVPKGRAK